MAFAVLFALAALDSAGYSIIAPVVPEIGDATGAGPGLMGALVASFARRDNGEIDLDAHSFSRATVLTPGDDTFCIEDFMKLASSAKNDDELIAAFMEKSKRKDWSSFQP